MEYYVKENHDSFFPDLSYFCQVALYVHTG